MLFQHNIDRNDAAYNTKAPFRYECPLNIGAGSLDTRNVRSIVAYCDEEATPPVRLHSVSLDPEHSGACRAEFTDAAGQQIGIAYLLKYIGGFHTTFILNQYMVIKGHISYNSQLTEELMQAARMADGKYTTDDNDFVLLPQCHVARFKGHMRAIRINGTLTHSYVHIWPKIEMHSEYVTADLNAGYADRSYILSLAEPFEEGVSLDTNPTLNGLTWLSVNNLDSIDMSPAASDDYAIENPFLLSGVHLVIRSSDTSNIRVISTDKHVTFTGVQDV